MPLRGLDFSMCPFDNEVSVIRAFNSSVVYPNANLQLIDSAGQLEYFVLVIVVLYDESIMVNLGTLNQLFMLLSFRIVPSCLSYFLEELILQLPEIFLSFS